MTNDIPKRILVADDETELREVLKDKLEIAGFTVDAAKDGKEALVLAFEHNPDLILLDLMMPNKDGFEVLTELREHQWGRNIPIILLTNLDDYESLSKVLEKQGHDYLVKTDWKIDDIVQKVKDKLKIS